MLSTIAEQRHHVPGRMRLRLVSGERNRALLDRIREELARAPGVRDVACNPANASFIIRYDPAMYSRFSDALTKFAAERDLMTIQTAGAGEDDNPSESVTDRSLRAVLGGADTVVRTKTRNTISLKELLPFGLAAYSVVAVNPAMAAAQWLSWISFAWNAYFDLHQDEPVHEVGTELRALRSEIGELRALLERGEQLGAIGPGEQRRNDRTRS